MTGTSGPTGVEASVGSTKDNPVPVGSASTVGKWKIQVVGLTPNADVAVHNANQFNAKPKDGFQYVMITLKSTWTGNGSNSPYFDQTWSLISANGTSYGDVDAVLPNDLVDANAVPNGANAVGNVGFQVPTAQVGGVTLYIEAGSGPGVFFALS